MQVRTPSIIRGCLGHLGPLAPTQGVLAIPEGALSQTWMLTTCVTLALSLYLLAPHCDSVKLEITVTNIKTKSHCYHYWWLTLWIF